MGLIIKEVNAKSILSKSGIPGADYCINAYAGCAHACKYCYATFMKRFTGHTEPWGSFVDVKINAPEILQQQIKRAQKGQVMLSSVTDAYQPVEARYRITRKCLEVLLQYQFPVDILTKSPLVLRDIDLIKKFSDISVGITITTDDEKMRKVFEPKAPPIGARINALRQLHENGIRTYVFVGPMLPMNPEILCDRINNFADYIFIDRMNYPSKTSSIFHQLKLQYWLETDFTNKIIKKLQKGFRGNCSDVS